MPSNYAAFEVKIDNDDGSSTMLPLQVVHVFDVTNTTILADLTSDSFGIVAAGSLSVAVGTLIRFWFYKTAVAGNAQSGVCGYAEVFTT
jgi:hypothetical protein